MKIHINLAKILHKTVLLRPLLALFGVKPKTVVGKAMDAAEVVDKVVNDQK